LSLVYVKDCVEECNQFNEINPEHPPLQLHQLENFDELSKPLDFNLIVAVSFGLLIPEKVIKSAKYGGLNVHPSLLPE